MNEEEQLRAKLNQITKELFEIQITALELGLHIDMTISVYKSDVFGELSKFAFEINK